MKAEELISIRSIPRSCSIANSNPIEQAIETKLNSDLLKTKCNNQSTTSTPTLTDNIDIIENSGWQKKILIQLVLVISAVIVYKAYQSYKKKNEVENALTEDYLY